MNILITGVHGFVGSNLVAALKTNHKIYGLDIISPNKEGVIKTFSWNELDLIPEIDVIIHLAGKAHDTKNQTNAQIYFDINTGLTQKVYDWFLTTNACKFVFFSSVKAAADKVEGDFLTEDVTPTPLGPYGESKIAAENYLISCQLTANNSQFSVDSENVEKELSTNNCQLPQCFAYRFFNSSSILTTSRSEEWLATATALNFLCCFAGNVYGIQA